MLSFVTLKNEERGMAVLTNSTREYEIIGGDYDTIAITLFRGVGFLGKEEMYRRPGRPSGIKLETPDSQMLGKVSLDFGIYPYVSREDKVSRVAKEYLTPVYTYNKMPHNAMKLNSVDFETPYNYSLYSSCRNYFDEIYLLFHQQVQLIPVLVPLLFLHLHKKIPVSVPLLFLHL